ncbi:unnamed protein product [Lymnaea stagnalis]|uniref:Ig-like domain-containing protein n=1 Tax=Lymnaea stagnalis TaxID=6523 RepID=A0AAV2ICY6_LYMST
MPKAACFVAWCLFAAISSSTLALENTTKTEVRRVPPGEMIHITCSPSGCDKLVKEENVEMIALKKWTMSEKNMSLLATMRVNKIMDKKPNELVTVVSDAHDINVTGSQQELCLFLSTNNFETGDTYHCLIFFWKEKHIENVSCITHLEVEASSTLPESTTGATRRVSAHAEGGSPQLSQSVEYKVTESVSLQMVGVGITGVAILLISATLILNIITYIRLSSGDFLQQATKLQVAKLQATLLPSKPDTVEELVATEPIYSVIKK